MSRKDYIAIAEACVDAIKRKYVKKKDIEDFIYSMSRPLQHDNYRFSLSRFEDYIMTRI